MPAFIVALIMLALAFPAAAQTEPRASFAPPDMQAVAPGLAGYTDDVLYGDVWRRADLTPRDRSMVTVSALIGGDNIRQLGGHVGRALDNGVTPAQLLGVINAARPYVSKVTGNAAAAAAREVFARRSLAPTAITNALSERDASLVLVSILIANGDIAQLSPQLERALYAGLTRDQIGGVITHLAFYCGWPRAVSATTVARSIFDKRNTPAGEAQSQTKPPLATLEIVRRAAQPAAPAPNFTGAVKVESRFNPSAPARFSGGVVTFTAGARTAWHTHPIGQTLVVTAGCGWVQQEGLARQTIAAGDVVLIPPGARHWHGATATTPMTHVAITEAGAAGVVAWLDQVSDKDYLADNRAAVC